jgi:glycerol-3-phosphate dehydrogenase
MYDLVIIGGGINGCGIARDAAGRGLSVCLLEQNDLASGTSSASTKLIHGGLRYLEHYEFRLVREALMEREVLWGIAPHIVRPLRFVLPHQKGLRPAWLLRLGLFLYDHLGGRKRLPPTKVLDLTRDPAGMPLERGSYGKAFEYSDCWVDDARLVVLNAQDAARHGATIRTHAKVTRAERRGDSWIMDVEDPRSRKSEQIEAGVLINAAGPWVADVLTQTCGQQTKANVRLVQGSHIIVPRLFKHERCYIFQNKDNRIIFAIPYEGEFTLIGTTDRDYTGDPAQVRASGEEIAYLCAAANEYFIAKLTPQDVVWTYSGVRPLYDDGTPAAQAATRDYALDLNEGAGAPLLSVFGGKITTYRQLALHALDKLKPFLPERIGEKPGWTGNAPLPGGEFAIDGFGAQVGEIQRRYPWLAVAQATRLVRAYGTNARAILGQAHSPEELGRDFGAGLSEAEVLYLMQNEWAQNAADILVRRTKLGLHFTKEQAEVLEQYMAGLHGAA